MTRARMPRPHEVAAARRDPRLIRAVQERTTDESWRTRARCHQVDPDTFFPAAWEPAEDAVAVCRRCVVQGPCLAWALDSGDCYGVWGATTPRERRAMLVAWQTETASRIPPERQPRLIPIRMSAGSRQGVRPVAVRHATSQLSG